MGRLGGLVLAALALTGCAEQVSACASCADPRVLVVELSGRVPHELPVQVCVLRLPCEVVDPPANGRSTIAVTLPEGTDPRTLDGRAVGITATGRGFDAAAYSGSGSLRFVDAQGECGCDHLRGSAVVRQDH